MEEKTDYEKMAEEYGKVKPLVLQAAPFLGEEGREKEEAIRPIARLIGIYTRIDGLLFAISVESGAVRDIILSAQGVCQRLCKKLSLLYTEASGGEFSTLKKNERPGYTPAIRLCLTESAEGCASALCYTENAFLSNKLPIAEIQTLHLLLLTLTAF